MSDMTPVLLPGPDAPVAVRAPRRAPDTLPVTAATGPATSAAGPGARDGFLDMVRAIAVVRVVLWHAFGVAAITYVVAAVPAMFFVTGSLLAKSFDRRPPWRVVTDRVRRMLVPLWAFAAVAWGAMAVAHVVGGTGTTILHPRSVVFWLLPLGNPQGSAWEAGWMSSPLWYLRVLLWLFVLAPLLVAALRRHRTLTLGTAVALVLVADWVGRHPTWTVRAAPDLVWQLGDLPLYATFLLLGACHRDGVLAGVTRRGWLVVAAVAGALAALWCTTQPVPLHVVNNSHPAHLLVGAAWLALALAFAGPLGRLATDGPVAPLVRFVTQRSMTIYLWHSTAIILSVDLLVHAGRFPRGVWSVELLLLTALLTAVFVAMFGWVEDLGGRRTPRLWPRRGAPHAHRRPRPLSMRLVPGAVAVAATVALLFSATAPPLAQSAAASQASVTSRLPKPSQQPPRPDFSGASSAEAAPAGVGAAAFAAPEPSVPAGPTTRWQAPGGAYPAVLAPAADPALGADLQAALAGFVAGPGMPGASVAVLRPGQLSWAGSAEGTDAAHPAPGVDTAFDIMSITKLFTGALVVRAAQEGLIDLDAPLPRLAAVPGFAYGAQLTPRLLLTHQSGLHDYHALADFAAHPERYATAAATVAAVGRAPLDFEPGTTTAYSSSNFLVLGLLLEQVEGAPIEQLIADTFLRPYGLDRSHVEGPSAGRPNSGTAGVVTDLADLVRAGVVLLRDHAVVGDAGWATMNDIDLASGVGGGVWIYCPCATHLDGTYEWRGVGHSGSTTMLVYSPDDDLVIAVNLGDTAYVPDGRYVATVGFIETLRSVVARHTGFVPGERPSGPASAGRVELGAP